MKTPMKAMLILLAMLANAAMAGVDTDTDANDVILAGHDPVAYFTDNKPVEGDARFTAAYQGAVYRFASAANRDTFQSNPEKYAPAYGGFCALGASFGKKFSVDGKAFEIVEGRLYVNKNLQAYKVWQKDVPGNIVKAEGQWPQIAQVAASDL
ncbi:MAG: YHS domain-containing (seleno)protein [Pseudomonadota bacterium]